MTDSERKLASQLVDARIEQAAVARGVSTDNLRLELLDHTRFLTDEGDVDPNKVVDYVTAIQSPSATKSVHSAGRRIGNGTQSVATGAQLYRERHNSTTQPDAT
jgi:hypothetical protein